MEEVGKANQFQEWIFYPFPTIATLKTQTTAANVDEEVFL
jgi:hypothetical protein